MRIENKMYRSLGRLNKLPASWREAVQTRLMGRFVPFLGTAGLRFEHISREQVRVSVRNRRAVRPVPPARPRRRRRRCRQGRATGGRSGTGEPCGCP